MKNTVIISFLLFLLSQVVSSQNQPVRIFRIHREYASQNKHSENIEDIVQSVFIPADSLKITIHPDSVYWFRYTIIPLNYMTHSYMVIQSRQYSVIELYFQVKNNFMKQQAGLGVPFSLWEHKAGTAVFALPAADSMVCYLKVRSHNVFPDGGRFQMREPAAFFNTNLSDRLYNGFFLGLAILASLYTLTFFFRLREKTFLYYSLYVISLVGYASVDWGLVIPPMTYLHIPWTNDLYTIPFASITIFLLLYARSFLDTKKNLPVFDRIILGSVFLRIAIYFTGLFFNIRWLYSPYIDNILLSTAFIAAIMRWKSGFKPARYLILAFVVLFSGLLVHSFRYLIQTKTLPTLLTLYKTGMVEIFLFSLALADRFKTLKDDKEQSQQQTINALTENQQLKDNLNRELEQKVKERTLELEQANNRIAEMNALLQVDNKRLSGDVKSISRKRVMQSIVTFDEFKEIYTDDEACYRYLETLKWEKGFTCRKCGHEKYSAGTTPYSRRCSRCNYIETITAGTIFANVKFPLHKAFYIVFLTTSGKYMSVDEISAMIDLRRQTCWSFRKKIEDVLEAGPGNKKKKITWTDILITSGSLNVEETE